MARVVYDQAFDFRNLDFSSLFGDGSFTNETSTGFTVTDGDYSADVTGENFGYVFGFPVSGVAHGVSVSYLGASLFHGSRFNVDVAEVIDDAGNERAILDDFFGGRDDIRGSNGRDSIFGYNGRDDLSGQDGNDFIVGGRGQDNLTGGRNSDTFAFTRASDSRVGNGDLITDLDDAHDTIDLHRLHVSGQIVASYDAVNDVTTFSIDVDNDLIADMEINALGNHVTYSGFET